MKTVYETDRLYLKILTPAWAEAVFNFYAENRTFFEPWEPTRQPNFYTIEFHKKSLQFDYMNWEKGLHVRFWIFRKNDPYTPIGTVCLQNITRGVFQSCVLGYKISEQFTRMGYAQEAILKTINIAFFELGLHRIEAYIHLDNSMSIRFIEKIGFQREGIKYHYAKLCGTWQDHYCYSLLSPFS